jgi:hypothetical protein
MTVLYIRIKGNLFSQRASTHTSWFLEIDFLILLRLWTNIMASQYEWGFMYGEPIWSVIYITSYSMQTYADNIVREVQNLDRNGIIVMVDKLQIEKLKYGDTRGVMELIRCLTWTGKNVDIFMDVILQMGLRPIGSIASLLFIKSWNEQLDTFKIFIKYIDIDTKDKEHNTVINKCVPNFPDNFKRLMSLGAKIKPTLQKTSPPPTWLQQIIDKQTVQIVAIATLLSIAKYRRPSHIDKNLFLKIPHIAFYYTRFV